VEPASPTPTTGIRGDHDLSCGGGVESTFHGVRWNDTWYLQLDRVDRIAAGDEQGAAIGDRRTPVRRTDLLSSASPP
jgi:hypothetical protein